MTKEQATKRIYLSGIKAVGYIVQTGGLCDPITVPDTKVGNAIVRALREVAMSKD